jgi:F-type H+-transporting ATPase subunit b
MMGNFLLFLMTAEPHGKAGFGLNLNIFEANLINLAILVGILFYFGRKTLGNILSERSSNIAQAIAEAEQRQKNAAEVLAKQQQQLAQAQAQAESIRKNAQESAKGAAAAIAAQTEKDIQRLKEMAAQDLSSEQQRVIAELRQRVVAMSLEKVKSQLAGRLDESAQQQLINRSIAQLGGS